MKGQQTMNLPYFKSTEILRNVTRLHDNLHTTLSSLYIYVSQQRFININWDIIIHSVHLTISHLK